MSRDPHAGMGPEGRNLAEIGNWELETGNWKLLSDVMYKMGLFTLLLLLSIYVFLCTLDIEHFIVRIKGTQVYQVSSLDLVSWIDDAILAYKQDKTNI